jgi:hypothetical protein
MSSPRLIAPSPPRHSSGRYALPALIVSVATLLTFLSRFVVPRGRILFEIPMWVTPLASTLGMAGALALLVLPRFRRAARAVSAAALALLLWAAGGGLFDVLMVIGRLIVPDLPMIDWPMSATRMFALVAAALLFRAIVHDRRCARGECLRCGQGPSTAPIRQKRWLGCAGFLFGLPYPLLKTHWAMGGTIGLDYPDPARDGFSSGWLVVPAALIGLVLSLALVHRWGRIWPDWAPFLAGKRTPRGLLLFGGWFGSALLLTMGIVGTMQDIALFSGGPVASSGGMHAWPSTVFYASWLLWGLVFAPATRIYQLRTQRHCASCGLEPDPA